jgi:hypothetical protein
VVVTVQATLQVARLARVWARPARRVGTENVAAERAANGRKGGPRGL